MNRLDAIIIRRIALATLVALIMVLGVFLLLELLNYPRNLYLNEVGGLPLVLTAMFASSGRLALRALSVIVLMGTILGVLDLQARQEMSIIRASGASVWRVLRAPLIAAALVGLAVGLFVENATTQLDRRINPAQTANTGAIASDGALWLEQNNDAGRYILRAGQVQLEGTVLGDVIFFLFYDDAPYSRITAPTATLTRGAWVLPQGTGYTVGLPPRVLIDYELPTRSTAADVRFRLASTDDLTFFELAAILVDQISDPLVSNAVLTRFTRLLSQPLLLMGSVLMAFAFTAGYRRTHKYGPAIVSGIVLGFVVFIVTEMADRAGTAGALNPIFAAVGPTFVGAFVGIAVLLYREDGRV